MDHKVIWLGGLFQPEAWITATHQAAARKFNMSLEELDLDIEFSNVTAGFKVKGDSKNYSNVKKCSIKMMNFEKLGLTFTFRYMTPNLMFLLD